MIATLRNTILRFLESERETPLLAGLAAGLYPVLFYYNNNYGMADSLPHLLFFSGFFIVLPTALLTVALRMVIPGRLKVFRGAVLAAFCVFVFLFLLMICLYGGISKKMLAGIFIITGLFVWMARKHYKKVMLLQFLMAAAGVVQLLPDVYRHITYHNDWAELLPGEQDIAFTKKPNIYMLQPDGYAGFSELKKGYYAYDNSAFEGWLSTQGFSLYPDFRSNYYSTLSSNSALFAMKHHYYGNALHERDDITGKNNALSVLKANGYTTFLLLEKEYLIADKPELYYDFCNISNRDVPFIGTALTIEKDVLADLKTAMQNTAAQPCFFFIEQLQPGHVPVYARDSRGAEAERLAYLERLETANTWLREVIGEIRKRDPEGLIIVIADHGGFVGMQATSESAVKTTDRDLIYSIFTAGLAVKWPEGYDHGLDAELVSSVNVFRALFSYLSDSRTLLRHKADNSSYIQLYKNAPPGVYAYIADNGTVQCKKRE